MYAEIDSFIPSKAIAATYVANAGISLRRFRRASISWHFFIGRLLFADCGGQKVTEGDRVNNRISMAISSPHKPIF